jgi:hypothetical protein
MAEKGRHANRPTGVFYRDLALMVLGILLVGSAVFLLLFLLADDGSTEAISTSSSSTATTLAETTSSSSVVTTTSSTTTTTTVTTTTETPVPVRPPDEVRVVALNAGAPGGAAGRFSEVLDEAGYQTLPADDYSPDQDPSRIWYREGFSAEANEILEFLPEALVEPLPDEDLQPGADVIVLLGTGYEE